MEGKSVKFSPVAVIQGSENKKLSTNHKVNATYVSQATCPKTCPFFNKGCYAETGLVGYTTLRLNRCKEQRPTRIANLEAMKIREVKSSYPLRLHVVGDCASQKAARIVSEAANEYIEKHNQPVWGYTHNRIIPRDCWGNISILRSCTTIKQAQTAHDAGFAVALIVPEFKNNKRYYIGRGLYGIPCPVQTKMSNSCVDCKLCMKDKFLQEHNLVILLEAHGTFKHKIKAQLINQKN
jgi:hypothetical protein